MENQRFCPIGEALLQIEASAKTTRDLINTLYFLQRTILSILNHSEDWISIGKENNLSSQKALLCEQVRHFLDLIGLSTENVYQHGTCDESIKLLEETVRIINNHIDNLKIDYLEEKSNLDNLGSHYCAKSLESPVHMKGSPREKGSESKTRCAKLKDMLARHLKQDQVNKDGIVNRKKSEEAPDTTFFNSEGYFYQGCHESKKRKCFVTEIFDGHGFNSKQKGSAFSSLLKLG